MRTIFRWLVRGLAALGLVVALGFALLYAADPVIATRLAGLPFGGGQGPEEVVKGGRVPDAPLAPPDRRTISPAALEAAVAYGAKMGSHALLVWHDGAIQLEHYYPGYDRHTRTNTQSMHKSVLAMVVGLAIRDGYIGSVDDPAAKYLPEWSTGGRERITLRSMLQQQSGIDFETVGFNPTAGFFQLVLGADIAPVILGEHVAEAPYTRFDYNTINPQALGMIVERATGRRYAQYLSDALWQKVSADDAAVVLDSREKGLAHFFCCLNATARSWLNVGRLHLDGGRLDGEQVVPEEWMRQVRTPSPRNPDYGFLTWLGTEYVRDRYYNHKGSTHAYHSEPFAAPDVVYFDGFGGERVYVVPSLGLVVVRTGNLRPDWDDAVLPNLIIRGIVK